MKIVVIARALNEERFIRRFLRGYDFADHILIADGGCADKTVQIALEHPKVRIRTFEPKIYSHKDPRVFRNPMSSNVQFLIDWAAELDPDWILFDDIDSVPNFKLKQEVSWLFHMLQDTDFSVINAYRMYLWGPTKHFPDLMLPGTNFWGWNPRKVTVYAEETGSIHQNLLGLHDAPTVHLPLPLCLLHTPWPDMAAWEEKKRWYEVWDEPQRFPPDACGPLADLPPWGYEDRSYDPTPLRHDDDFLNESFRIRDEVQEQRRIEDEKIRLKHEAEVKEAEEIMLKYAMERQVAGA